MEISEKHVEGYKCKPGNETTWERELSELRAFLGLGHKPNFFLGDFQVSGMEQGPSFYFGERLLISESGWCLRKGVSYFQVRKVCLKEEALGR